MDHEHKNTFLFAWNPVKYAWPGIGETIARLQAGEKVTEDWSCASYKKINKGERAFFSIVGSSLRGLFASGHVVSQPFIGKNHKGREAHRVLVEFDVLLDPAKETILTLDLLQLGKTQKQLWTPQASGISIKPEVCEELEALWQDFLESLPRARSGERK